jgi:hypothetical protein
MWPNNFADRLKSWAGLREQTQTQDLEQALDTINTWWFNTPWKSYYLHWDDQSNWPDPWQLLSDNVYCEVARGLGILYTISMIEHPAVASADLVLTEDGHNLVLVNKEKYILNWEREIVLNTHQAVKFKKKLSLEQTNQQYQK